MNNLRSIAPPVLPLPPSDYSLTFQNLLNSALQQYCLRASNAVNSLITSSTPQALAYSSVLTFTPAALVTYRVNLTGNVQVNPPQDASDGDTVILWVSAGNAARTVSFGANLITPSTITVSATITANKKAVYTLRYDAVLNGGQWELTAYQNGY